MSNKLHLPPFVGRKHIVYWEVFAQKFSIVYPAKSSSLASVLFKEEFGEEPILAVIRYDLAVRGDILSKRVKSKPWAFIIRRNSDPSED